MISTAHNTKPFNLDSFRSSIRPQRALNCILATICIICVCAIAVVSAIVVREYSLSEDYQAALCRIENLTYADLDGQCLYCSGTVDKTRDRKIDACHIVYLPCLRATVTFNVLGHTHRGMLYSDTNQATGHHRQCSVSVCHKTRPENARHVDEFSDSLASHGNSTFLCYYDTQTLDNAILEKSYSKSDVFHYLFWPSLGIVICGLVFLYMECHRKGMVVCPCGRSNDPSAAEESRSLALSEVTKGIGGKGHDNGGGKGHAKRPTV